MNHIYSTNGQLLHTVVRAYDFQPGRVNVSAEKEFLQCALLRFDKGKTFKAHKHIPKQAPAQLLPQESWCVIKGSVKVFFYDTDGYLMHTDVLKAGDASFTYHGYHNYEILEDNSHIFEYKTGPYMGILADKVFL